MMMNQWFHCLKFLHNITSTFPKNSISYLLDHFTPSECVESITSYHAEVFEVVGLVTFLDSISVQCPQRRDNWCHNPLRQALSHLSYKVPKQNRNWHQIISPTYSSSIVSLYSVITQVLVITVTFTYRVLIKAKIPISKVPGASAVHHIMGSFIVPSI